VGGGALVFLFMLDTVTKSRPFWAVERGKGNEGHCLRGVMVCKLQLYLYGVLIFWGIIII